MAEELATLREATLAVSAVQEQIKHQWRVAAAFGAAGLAVAGFFYHKLDQIAETADKAQNSVALSAKDLEKVLLTTAGRIDARLSSAETKLDVSLSSLKEILVESNRRTNEETSQVRNELRAVLIRLGGQPNPGPPDPKRSVPTSTGTTGVR